ncbi:MAG: hypothetical protein NZ750_07475 [Anaerolineae bacterium]|nr:hypothetical protein [Anaerolineae bacterium]MDW8172188.1 hypothetical protein [Anaerolineae bacterium]
MRTRLVILVAVAAILAALAIAQTPTRPRTIPVIAQTRVVPTPDPKDNACYPGGSMAGRCENDNHWNAGWYYARWEQGIIRREDVPAIYAWVLSQRRPVTPGQ